MIQRPDDVVAQSTAQCSTETPSYVGPDIIQPSAELASSCGSGTCSAKCAPHPLAQQRTVNLKEPHALDAKTLMTAASVGDVKAVEAAICKSSSLVGLRSPTRKLDDVFNTTHPQLGYTVLHAAVDFSQDTVVQLLLSAGANPNTTRARKHQTPLHLAATAGHAQIVAMLLSHGADATIRDDTSRRPFELLPLSLENSVQTQMRDSLKDKPGQIDSVLFTSIEARQFKVIWMAPPYKVDTAPTIHYHITWGQPEPRLESTAYVEARATVSLPARFLPAQTESVRASGSKQRHVRRKDRIQKFDTWWVKTRRPAHFTRKGREETPLSCLVSELFPATRYSVTVRANNAAGYGPPSLRAFVTTAHEAPEAPSEPFLVHAMTTHVVAAWLPPHYSNGSAVDEYEVQVYVLKCAAASPRRVSTASKMTTSRLKCARALTPDAKTISHPLDLTRAKPNEEASDDPKTWCPLDWCTHRLRATKMRPSFVVSGLAEGDQCVLRVRARNANGWSTWSANSQLFSATQSLRVHGVSTRSLYLEWCAHTALAACWEIQYQQVSCNNEWIVIDDAVPAGATMRRFVNLLIPGATYRFRVRPKLCHQSWRAWDETPLVSVAVKMKEDIPDRCFAPLREQHNNLAAADEIRISWQPGCCNGQPITKFELQRIVLGGRWEYARTVSVPSSQNWAIIKDLELGSPEIFRVRARNAIGWSPWSPASRSVIVYAVHPPSTPVLKRRGVTWVHVEWSPPADPNDANAVLAYHLYFKMHKLPACAPWATLKRNLDLTESNVIVPDLKPAASYIFKVKASTLNGTSAFSAPSPPFSTMRRH